MASSEISIKFHLFNCDGTFKLDSVETLLLKVADDLNLKILVDKRNFHLREISDVVENIIPRLQMDYAVLVVHAQESRLSISEDNAGIGYAKIYRALLRATGDKVLIVIGGDDNYRGDEKEQVVLSRWIRRKVASQFDEEYLDGRKSFIFSWNKGHREIHEEALEHYLNPSKRGEKFQFVPKQASTACETTDSLKGGIDDDKEPHHDRNCRFQEKEERGLTRRRPVNASPCYLEGTVLLDTVMRFGRISYEEEDVKVWDHRWEPSETIVRHLSNDWMLRPLANVRFVATANDGVSSSVRPQNIWPWLFSYSLCLNFFQVIWTCMSIYIRDIWFEFTGYICGCYEWYIEEVTAKVERFKTTLTRPVNWLLETIRNL